MNLVKFDPQIMGMQHEISVGRITQIRSRERLYTNIKFGEIINNIYKNISLTLSIVALIDLTHLIRCITTIPGSHLVLMILL